MVSGPQCKRAAPVKVALQDAVMTVLEGATWGWIRNIACDAISRVSCHNTWGDSLYGASAAQGRVVGVPQVSSGVSKRPCTARQGQSRELLHVVEGSRVSNRQRRVMFGKWGDLWVLDHWYRPWGRMPSESPKGEYR